MVKRSLRKCDILVIGGGPVGLVSALWFAKRNYQIICIEQYQKRKTKSGKSFNERHQQVGLNKDSLEFLREIDEDVYRKITEQGCKDGDWINIPIYVCQNILYEKVRKYRNCKIIFSSKIVKVKAVNPTKNCQIFIEAINRGLIECHPKIIIIADGKEVGGVAETYFNFPSAYNFKYSTYGIVGMISRKTFPLICLKNVSTNNYRSQLHPEIGPLYFRLLGSYQERYIALGITQLAVKQRFHQLSPSEIEQLLLEAYNKFKMTTEPNLNKLTQYSNQPIQIMLGYRQQTIKIFENSNTLVTIQGDAARKTSFFSGTALNTGYKSLKEFFQFCQSSHQIIFSYISLSEISTAITNQNQKCHHISNEFIIEGYPYFSSPPLEQDYYYNPLTY